METFIYYRPESLSALFELMKQYAGRYRLLAGGTDLLVRLKSGSISPEAVIDIKSVAELQTGIVQDTDSVTIDALTLMAILELDPFIIKTFPALAEAVHNVGSVQIRNRASIAGNLCNASPAADSAPSLLIYNARVNCISPLGERSLPLPEFITGPGRTTALTNSSEARAVLPLPPSNQAAAFTRLTRRKGVDLATINLCCQVTTTGTTRFALGAVGPVPFIVEDAEKILSSQEVSIEDKKAYLSKMMEKATPITDVRASKEYRQAMLTVLGMRALNTAQERLSNNQQESL